MLQHPFQFLISSCLLIMMKLSSCYITIIKDILTNQSLSTLNSTFTYQTHIVGTSAPNTYGWNSYTAQIFFIANATHPDQHFPLITNIRSPIHIIRSWATNTYYYNSTAPAIHGVFLVIQNGQLATINFDTFLSPLPFYNCLINRLTSTAQYHNISGYFQYIHEGIFISQTQILLLIGTPYGLVLKYFSYSISNWSSIAPVSSFELLLPTAVINITNGQKYARKMIYNKINNNIFIALSACIASYSLDRANNNFILAGYKNHGWLVLWNNIDFSVSKKNVDLIAIWKGNHSQIYNITTWNQLGYWQLISQVAPQVYGQCLLIDPPYLYMIQKSNYPSQNVFSNSTLPPPPNTIPYITYIHFIQYDFAMVFNTATNMYDGGLINYQTMTDFRWNQQLAIVGNQLVIYHIDMKSVKNPEPVDHLYVADFNNQMLCVPSGCSACPPTYNLTANMTCIKVSNILPNSTPIPISNTQTFNNKNNTSDTINVLQIIIVLNESHYLCQAYNLIARLLPFTSMKIIPQLFFSLIILLDDLWYYKFHQTVYPLQAQFFMEKVDAMSYIHYLILKNNSNIDNSNPNNSESYQTQYLLSAIFFDSKQYITSSWPALAISTKKDNLFASYFQYQKNYQNMPDSFYFSNSTFDIYTNQLIFNAILFVALKILHLIFYFMGKVKKHAFFKYLYKMFKHETKLWTYVVAIVGVNMIRLVFSCFLQMSMPHHFEVVDRLNFLFMVVVLYLAALYSLFFYSLIFEVENSRKTRNKQRSKGKDKNIVNKQNHKQTKKQIPSQILLSRSLSSGTFYPYIHQSLCIVTRNFLRSAIHAYFLSYYSIQISLLFITDLYCLLLTIKNRKWHINKIIFAEVVVYYLLFCAFDGFFMVKALFFVNQKSIDYYTQQIFSFSVLASLVIISILQVLTVTIMWLIKLFKAVKKFFSKQFDTQEEENQKSRREMKNIKKLTQKLSTKMKSCVKAKSEDNKNIKLVRIVNQNQFYVQPHQAFITKNRIHNQYQQQSSHGNENKHKKMQSSQQKTQKQKGTQKQYKNKSDFLSNILIRTAKTNIFKQ